MEVLNHRITVGQDRTASVYDVPPGTYRQILIPIDTDVDGWRKFYRGVLVPNINHQRIERLGITENEKETHALLKDECNGGRSTTMLLDKNDWKNYVTRIQSYCIQELEIDWQF